MMGMTTYPDNDTPCVSRISMNIAAKEIARELIDGFGSDPQTSTVHEAINDWSFNRADAKLLETMVQKLISTATVTIHLDESALAKVVP